MVLNDAERLTDVIVGGTREDISMERLMAQVHNEYMKEVAEKGERVNEDELTKRIHRVLNSSGSAKINALGEGEAETSTIVITDEIKEMAKQETLKNVVEFAKKNGIELTSWSLGASSKKRKAISRKDDSDEDYMVEEGLSKRRVLIRAAKKIVAAPVATRAKRATTTTASEEPVKTTEPSLGEEKKSEAGAEDESINIDQARRLVKKVIARNK